LKINKQAVIALGLGLNNNHVNNNRLVIVIARRYDEAIPKMQIEFAQLLCNSGIAPYLIMTSL